MDLSKVVRADFGSNLKVRGEYTRKEKLEGFLTLVRPIFLLMTPLNAASAAILSIRGLPSWQLCLAGFVTGALAAAGVNSFNKYADRARDQIIWPSRSIPSGRVKPLSVLVLSLAFYLVTLAAAWIFFNPTAFVILLAAIVLGSLYSTHLRDKVGYLSLPLIEGLIFLCGWAALSPATVFTILPWYLYLLGVVWQSAHIVVHYILHIRYDEKNQPIIMTPLLFSRPSPQSASRAALGLLLLLFVLSVLLPFLTSVSFIYVVPVILYGIYAIYKCLALARTSLDNAKLLKAWSALSMFRMVISLALILSVLIFP
jgi:4-hydroxybenzoate polyprenyltransferase